MPEFGYARFQDPGLSVFEAHFVFWEVADFDRGLGKQGASRMAIVVGNFSFEGFVGLFYHKALSVRAVAVEPQSPHLYFWVSHSRIGQQLLRCIFIQYQSGASFA